MGDLVDRFLNFDKMIGTSLIKFIYYIGLGLIVIGTIISMLGALGGVGDNPLAALGGFIIMPVFGLIGIVFWRFVCEIYMLFFRISDDVAELKAMKSLGGSGPSAPQADG